jgi:Tfp pilus assembly protein FimT
VTTSGRNADQRWFARERIRTVVAVIATMVVFGATTAVAAKLITGADVKDGSLTGQDIKQGSIPKGDLKSSVQNALAIRITGALPVKGFSASNGTVANTPDGVTFGPYANGGAAGGSICTDAMDGQPFGDVTHLAYVARYTATNDTGGVGVPYLRVFLEDDLGDPHDAIFSPNTQSPDPDTEQGPFHTWVATAGSWRYDDDGGIGPDSPFAEIQGDHEDEVITDLCISVGNSAGTDLSALLRSWEINTKDYTFGQ